MTEAILRSPEQGAFSRLLVLLGLMMALMGSPVMAEVTTPVNINTATADEMSASLAGVGAAKAAAIVQYRDERGPFSDPKQLIDVPGVGAKTYERIKDQITVGPQ